MRPARKRSWVPVFVGLAVGTLLTGCEGEPRFEGKTAGYWQQKIKSPNSEDRWRAAVALGELSPPSEEAVRALAEATKDPESFVRFHAVRALSRLGAAAAPAAPELRERLQDSMPQTRQLAQLALDRIEKGAGGS